MEKNEKRTGIFADCVCDRSIIADRLWIREF